MSKIKELKTNTNNNLNFIEVLELFAPSKKSKYTETLLRLMNRTKNIDQHIEETKLHLMQTFDFITKEDLEKFGPIQILLLYRFLDGFFNYDDLRNFRKFCEYNERGLVAQNDLSTYKSFDDLMSQLNLAEMKVDAKQLEGEIVKVYEDDEWLLLRPLTYSASKKYGSNTKWCTTQESNSEYFIKYSSKGILIYCINKLSGYKVASFCSLDKNDPEFSFWNQKDTRIDSLQSELTEELLKTIREVCLDPKAKTNRYLLSDDQRVKEEKLLGTKLYTSGALYEQPSEPQELEQPERRLTDRIGAAIRRENEDVIQEDNVMEEAPSDMVDVTERVESIIDRMTWTSTTTTEMYPVQESSPE
jgi:hypothetical protein